MKNLLILLIATLSTNIFAGTLVNKTTSNTISFDLLEDAQVIVVRTDNSYKEIKLRTFATTKKEKQTLRDLFPETITNITNHDGVCSTDPDFLSMSIKRKFSRIGEVLFITPVVLVVDIVSLSKRIINKRNYNKAVKLIKKVVESDDTLRVSNKKFQRVLNTLNID
jgi:hypothetical protein